MFKVTTSHHPHVQLSGYKHCTNGDWLRTFEKHVPRSQLMAGAANPVAKRHTTPSLLMASAAEDDSATSNPQCSINSYVVHTE
jgi:hypothetical protein